MTDRVLDAELASFSNLFSVLPFHADLIDSPEQTMPSTLPSNINLHLTQ